MYKKFKFIAVLALCMALLFPVTAISAEKILKAKITDVVQAQDKNGQDYVRLIVAETRTLQGTEYSVGVPAMAFGQIVQQAQQYNIGDTLNAIVQQRSYQGRDSYTILSILPNTTQ